MMSPMMIPMNVAKNFQLHFLNIAPIMRIIVAMMMIAALHPTIFAFKCRIPSFCVCRLLFS